MEERRPRRSIPLRAIIAGIVALALFGVIGRGAYRSSAKMRECATLAGQVNPVLDEIRKLTSQKRDSATYRLVADRYANLSKLVPGLASPGFDQEAKEYADLLAASSVALRAGAAALEKSDLTSADASRRELDRLVRKDRAAVAKIEAYCRSN